MARKFFEDLSVGDRWDSTELTLSEADLIEFAEKYDPQPMHIDPEYARATAHGTIIASGWMVGALTLKLFIEAGGYGETPVLGLGTDELRWSKPVLPGDTLTVHREIVELRRSSSNPMKGLVRTRIWGTKQTGETVISMVSTGMIDARTDGGADA